MSNMELTNEQLANEEIKIKQVLQLAGGIDLEGVVNRVRTTKEELFGIEDMALRGRVCTELNFVERTARALIPVRDVFDDYIAELKKLQPENATDEKRNMSDL